MATKERTRKVKREITIAREATWVKDEGESEIKRKKKPLSWRKPVKDSSDEVLSKSRDGYSISTYAEKVNLLFSQSIRGSARILLKL